MKKKYLPVILLGLLGSAISMTTLAGDFIVGEKLQTMLKGKSADGVHHRKDYTYKIFFAADGRVTQVKGDGSIHKGDWSIEGDTHCIKWDEKFNTRCRPFKDNGDGTLTKYKVKNSGKEIRIITLSNFRDGNHTGK